MSKLTKQDLKLFEEYATYNKPMLEIAVELFGDKKYKHSAYMRMCRAGKVKTVELGIRVQQLEELLNKK